MKEAITLIFHPWATLQHRAWHFRTHPSLSQLTTSCSCRVRGGFILMENGLAAQRMAQQHRTSDLCQPRTHARTHTQQWQDDLEEVASQCRQWHACTLVGAPGETNTISARPTVLCAHYRWVKLYELCGSTQFETMAVHRIVYSNWKGKSTDSLPAVNHWKL